MARPMTARPTWMGSATCPQPPKAFGCVGSTIKLLSGSYLDLLNPDPDVLRIDDISNALSMICRFGGQVSKFYSVAEHSYHCYEIAKQDGQPAEIQLAVLCHDAAEAFIGDIVKPLKMLLPGINAIEDRIEMAIAEKFSIDFHAARDVIKEIDHAMLIAERHRLFDADNVVWTGQNEVRELNVSFQFWTPYGANIYWQSSAERLLKSLQK